MNLGLVTSFIVAGILMLGIVMVNINVQNSTAELTLAQITRNHVSSITDIINDDFSNMGYDVNTTTMETQGAIFDCRLSRRVSFYRNIYDNPDSTAKRIEWRFYQGEEIPETKNENHRLLVRTVHNVNDNGSLGSEYDRTEIRLGVTHFQLYYYDTTRFGRPKSEALSNASGCSDISDVRQIHVELEVQSAEKIYNRSSGQGRYIRSVWDKRFTPPNLNLE